MLSPEKKCTLCSRLTEFREENCCKFPSFHNSPVPSFGPIEAKMLVIGMAPGLKGANQTGRPFTGDYAGDLLYPVLKKFGLASGNYERRFDDGFELINVRVTNTVRCVPPQNKVVAEEVNNCRPFLISEIENMPNLKIILTLGSVAHNALLGVLGYPKSTFKFAHGACHQLNKHNIILLNSYHTSRYNVNTGVLTEAMFENVITKAKELLEKE